jgi:hypothetical protein
MTGGKAELDLQDFQKVKSLIKFDNAKAPRSCGRWKCELIGVQS